MSLPPVISTEQPLGEREARLIAWLSRHGPEDWHRSACSYDWGLGYYPLYWIISQDNCDKGTALHIFFLCSPDYYYDCDYGSKIGENYLYNTLRLLTEISQRWASGLYKQYNFNPNLINERLYDIDPARLPWFVPMDLAQPVIQGKSLSSLGFPGGYPESLLAELDAEGIPH